MDLGIWYLNDFQVEAERIWHSALTVYGSGGPYKLGIWMEPSSGSFGRSNRAIR
jgi:hypothetical protein